MASILGDLTGVAGHPNYGVNVVKLKCYVDRRVTPPKRVTSTAWGPPPPCRVLFLTSWTGFPIIS